MFRLEEDDTLQEIVLEERRTGFLDLAFTPSGGQLSALGADHSIVFLAAAPELLAKELRASVSRMLTDAEWRAHFAGIARLEERPAPVTGQ